MFITSHELARLAGVRYIFIDKWTRRGVLKPVNDPMPGSGHVRMFDTSNVEKVKVLKELVDIFEGGGERSQIRARLLKHIYDNFEDGQANLSNGIILKWKVEDERRS